MGAHCLRPEFTQQLLDSLLAGESINLMSPHGQGRRRTLHDLRAVLPKSWKVLQVDMGIIKKGESALLDALLKQVKIENIANIHDFMFKMNKTSINHLIIIHNFHFLTDLNVISYLNDIEKYPYISLLCVSEKKQKKSTLLAKDCMLARVTSAQLLAEIKRREFALNQKDMRLLAAFLLQQTSPYSLLDTEPKSWFTQALWKSSEQP